MSMKMTDIYLPAQASLKTLLNSTLSTRILLGLRIGFECDHWKTFLSALLQGARRRSLREHSDSRTFPSGPL